MRIAFYAPMKPISSANPSGDRLIGRLLKKALEVGGHKVEVASRFRSYDRTGNPGRQDRLKTIGQRMAKRVLRRLRKNPPDLWFTYHLYRKAPDWIGPLVCRELDIPYVVAEASFAPSQHSGDWAVGHRATADALAQVDLAFGLTVADEACLIPQLSKNAHFVRIKPFIDTAPFKQEMFDRIEVRSKISTSCQVPADVPWLLTVAMLRPGVKFESYQVLAEALKRCDDQTWHLLVVGNGPEKQAVQALFQGLEGRISWLGEKPAEDVASLYRACDIYVWPSVRESPGMTFLEAQASGVPVIGGDGGSVSDVIAHGVSGLLAKKRNADEFSHHLRTLLKDSARRQKMGKAAKFYVESNHTLEAAAKRLNVGLSLILP